VCLYDVNLRDHWWSPDIVAELIRLATVVKFSAAEAQELATGLGVSWQGPETFSQAVAALCGLRAVAVTAGSASASLWLDGAFAVQAPPRVVVADAVGAGDAFAAGLLDAIAEGLPAAAALRRANALGALVASRPGAQPEWTPAELASLEDHGRAKPAWSNDRRDSTMTARA
jgi:fructokinase